MHFHETAQASDVINKTATSQVDSFSERYVIDGRVQGEASEAGARDCIASAAAGVCGQLRKVSTQPNTENSVSRVRDRLSQDEDQPIYQGRRWQGSERNVNGHCNKSQSPYETSLD